MSSARPTPSAPTGRHPFLDLSATLVRRGYVIDYEAGERPLPLPDKVLRFGRAALLPLSTVACVRTDRRVVGLTYDDGPHPEHTPRVLQTLADHQAKATFFVMVEQAEKYPALITRIQAEGHEVALHGIDHTRLSGVPLRQAVALIRDGKQRLERLTGRTVTLFRPTYGAQTMQQYLATRAMGMEVVIWSGWGRDWDSAAAEEVAERALGSLHRGGFILMHDFSGDGVEAHNNVTGAGLDRGLASELLLNGMVERGYTSQTVSQLLAQYPAVRTVWAEKYSPNAPS